MLQSDTDTVSRWVDINELALNHIKCKYMVVSRLKSRAVPSPMMLRTVWSINGTGYQLQVSWSSPH